MSLTATFSVCTPKLRPYPAYSLSPLTSFWIFLQPSTCRRSSRTRSRTEPQTWNHRSTFHSESTLSRWLRYRYSSTFVSHSDRSKSPPLADSPPVVIPRKDSGISGMTLAPESASTTRRVPPETSVPGVSSVQARSSTQPQSTKPRFQLRPRKAAINLTPAAVSRLRALVSGPTPQLIRIGVRNKGCAGMSYHLDYVESPGQFDEVVEQDGVKVLIDSKALFSIIGSEMDWKEDRLSSKFAFKNPNIKDACGCGESFSI